MAICKQCRELADRSAKAFNPQERFHLLAAAVSMKNVIDASTSPFAEKDRIVNNSVITKLLLSLPSQQRESILQGFQQNAGIHISSTNCPHSPLDYKLNQLDGDVTKLRDVLGFAPPPTQEKPKPFSKTKKLEDRK